MTRDAVPLDANGATAADAGATDPSLAALANDVLYAPEQDMWARVDADGLVTIGATHVTA